MGIKSGIALLVFFLGLSQAAGQARYSLQEIQAAQSACDIYGFTRGTDGYAGCIQKELGKKSDNNDCYAKKRVIESKLESCKSACSAEEHPSGNFFMSMGVAAACRSKCDERYATFISGC